MGAEEVVDRMFSAIENGDLGALEEIYDPDLRLWRNFADAAEGKEASIARLAATVATSTMKYDRLERHVVGDRVIQRHTIRRKVEGEPEMAIHAAAFLTVRNGRITEIHTYVDPGRP